MQFKFANCNRVLKRCYFSGHYSLAGRVWRGCYWRFKHPRWWRLSPLAREEGWIGGVAWPSVLEEVVLLPTLGGAPASTELGGAIVSEMVSSAWCGATSFESASWPSFAPVARRWLEVAAGGVEGSAGCGCCLDVEAAASGWWAWRGAPWRVVSRWASCGGDDELQGGLGHFVLVDRLLRLRYGWTPWYVANVSIIFDAPC
jgi:hypothetical protein